MTTASESFVKADPLAGAAAAATLQLAQMAGDHNATLERQLDLARQRQAVLHNDAAQHLAAQRDIDALEAKIAREQVPALMTDEQRLEQALAGQVDHLGAETTVNQQIPQRDFAAAIADDLALGIRPDLLRAYHATGKSDAPDGHIHAATWFRLYENSPEMQRLHRDGDPKVCREFRYACIYRAGSHEQE